MSYPVGLLRLATILSYDSKRGLIEVNLDISNITINAETKKKVQVPFALYSVSGMFIGSAPEPGTPIVVGQGESGQWYFVSYLSSNVSQAPTLNTGEILIQSEATTKITIDNSGNINIGSDTNKLYINTESNLYIDNFDSKLSFTQASRQITGPIKREIVNNKNISDDSKLSSYLFDRFTRSIALDPSAPANTSTTSSLKNPTFVESRDVLYEFVYSADVGDELYESSLYGKSNQKKDTFSLPNRRKSRADALSLSLLSPNFLMESIKGTAVDIFGNILDINRTPLPIGKEDTSIRPDSTKDKISSYLKIRELQRKSIAFHFELNARKDFKGKSGQLTLPDINSNNDYARNRSRLFIDIDKEGMLKVNVPASSETGNIPLLVRYENYSSFGNDDNNNPNKLFFRNDKLDIFLDSFAKDGGVISIENENGIVTPQDRLTNKHLLHGTAHHNILKTCEAHQSNQFISYPYEPLFKISSIPILDPSINPVVSPKIIVGGSEANAGGRSGSINFDGSLDINVGANTVDRQSIWLDTAGGVVGNIGRDKNFISAAISMDGDLLLQVGGNGISADSRFSKLNNSFRPGAIDIRVFNAGFECTLIRIDNEGVKIITPGRMVFQSQGDMLFRSASSIVLDAERITIHDREVLKYPIISI